MIPPKKFRLSLSMKTLFTYIEKYAMRPMEQISQQRHLRAIRDAIMAAFPLSLIASLFMVVAVLPLPSNWGIKKFLVEHEMVLLTPYRMIVFIITLYIVIGVGSNLARHYHLDPLAGSLMAIIAFLMTITPLQASSLIPPEFIKQAEMLGLDISWMNYIRSLGWVIPENAVGETGILTGILTAIYGVEVLQFTNKRKAQKRAKKSITKTLIPAPVARTLETIMPIGIVIFTLFILRDILGLDIQKLMMNLMTSFVQSSTTLPGAILLVLVSSMLWTLGIRGLTIVTSAASPLWAQLIRENAFAYQNSMPLPNVAPMPFFQWFIWIGGAGSTLSLVILLCFSKNNYLRKLGLTSLIPSLTNANEPVIYGVPLILNPYLSIPFVLGPTLCTLLTYVAMMLNLVQRPFSTPPPNLPAPVGAYLSTGDWRAIVLCLFNMALCAAIYYPFVKIYAQKIEREGEENAKKRALTKDKAPKITPVD